MSNYYCIKFTVSSGDFTLKGAQEFFKSEFDKSDPELKDEAISYIESKKGVPSHMITINKISPISKKDWEVFQRLEQEFRK